MPIRSTATDSGGTRLAPSPTDRTKPSSTWTSGTPRRAASMIVAGATRDGQIATLPRIPTARRMAAGPDRKGSGDRRGAHRKRLISVRFHQAMPATATMARLAAI